MLNDFKLLSKWKEDQCIIVICLKFLMSFRDDCCDYSSKGPKNVAMPLAVCKRVCFSVLE